MIRTVSPEVQLTPAYTRRRLRRRPRGGTTVELRLDTRDQGDWIVLDIDGEIDLSTAPMLRSRIEELIRAGSLHLVVNLERVGFLDSSGLSALVAAMKAIEAARGELSLVCAEERLLKIFTVTGLDRVFEIHRSLDEATRP